MALDGASVYGISIAAADSFGPLSPVDGAGKMADINKI
jgi:hypothetical protein